MQNILMGRLGADASIQHRRVFRVHRASQPEAAAPKGPRVVRAATGQQTCTDSLWTFPTHFLLLSIPPANMITSLLTSS